LAGSNPVNPSFSIYISIKIKVKILEPIFSVADAVKKGNYEQKCC
jgi:hypothetical protein